MGKFGRVLFAIGILLLTSACCYLAYIQMQPGATWIQVDVPPETPKTLLLGDAGELLAEAEDGSLYEFSVYPEREWRAVDEPSGQPPAGRECAATPEGNLAKDPPGNALLRISEKCVYAESAFYFELAYLENGEFWYWERTDYAYTTLAQFMLVLLGAGLGALIAMLGGGLMIVQALLNTKKNGKI